MWYTFTAWNKWKWPEYRIQNCAEYTKFPSEVTGSEIPEFVYGAQGTITSLHSTKSTFHTKSENIYSSSTSNKLSPLHFWIFLRSTRMWTLRSCWHISNATELLEAKQPPSLFGHAAEGRFLLLPVLGFFFLINCCTIVLKSLAGPRVQSTIHSNKLHSYCLEAGWPDAITVAGQGPPQDSHSQKWIQVLNVLEPLHYTSLIWCFHV